MTHLRYKATDDSFDIDLRLEGMSEEEQSFWSIWLQSQMQLWIKLFDRAPEVGIEEFREE